MKRKQHIWAFLTLSVFFLIGSITVAGSYESPKILANIFEDANFTNSPTTAASVDLNLNQYPEGDTLAQPIQLYKNALYNLTIKNTGDAELFGYVVQTISAYSGTSAIPTAIYSDQLIRSIGIPWWGTYSAWDTESYSSRVSSGASVSSNTQKSIVFYLDDSFPSSSVQLTVLLKLMSTTNPYNNTATLEWLAIDTASPDFNIVYNATGIPQTSLILPNSYQIVEFSTANNADLTKTVLNETIGVNSSLRLFQWHKDLSGNTLLASRTLSGTTNTLKVPYFNNMRLDGQTFLGLVANLNPTPIAELSWNFSTVVATNNYSESSFSSPDMVEFQVNQVNRYWRVMEVPTAASFNITFIGSPISSQDYWDVRGDFYAIGKTNGLLFSLNNFGLNVTERASIFTTRQSTQYAAHDVDFLQSAFAPQTYTWFLNGTTSPVINLVEGTQYLGLDLIATQNPSAIQNFNCSIEITEIPIQDFVSGEQQRIGAANGSTYGNYLPFQVRKFSFESFDQFEWGFQAENASRLDSVTELKCNDADSEQYIPNLNNSLMSIPPIDTTGLQGQIWLRYNISGEIGMGDSLSVRIKNSSGISPAIRTYGSGSLSSTILYESLDITTYNSTELQIVYNFTSNAQNNVGEGPIIDNIRVTNGTDEVFFDGFEDDFSKWTQYDFSGYGEYWRLDRWTQGVNTPKIYIIYPNIVNQLTAYPADPATYTTYTYKTLSYNPYAQPSNVAYIVTTASGALVQNFTVVITRTTFSAQTFQDGALLTATHTLPSLVSQEGYIWEETTNIDECFEYHELHLLAGYTYSFSFTTQVAYLTSIPATVVDATGMQWDQNIPVFYGTFNINQTYEIVASQDQVVYFKFGDIGYGNSIQVVLSQTQIGEEPFPLLLVLAIIVAASVAVNVLLIYLLRKTRAGNLPAAQKRPAPAFTPGPASNPPATPNPPNPSNPPSP